VADLLTVAGSIAITQAGQSVVSARGFGAAGRVNALKLDQRLRTSPFEDSRIVLSGPSSQSAIAIAISAGKGIVNALHQLNLTAKLATHDSLVAPLAGLTIDGTRVSRLNVHSIVNQTLAQIDRLVAQSELNNANFISSSSGGITISTSRFGGRIGIVPQPLDTTGLNLRGLNLLTQENAETAVSRIESAINLATLRVSRLESLRTAVGSSNFTTAALESVIIGAGGGSLPSGSLVNLAG